ncbi:MerR family transcriptional regulator [Bacillus songklensis]
MLKEENNDLRDKLKNVLPSTQEQQRQDYLSLVKTFMNVSFYKTKEGYEERRKQAKEIMSEELFQQFYPTPNYEYGEGLSSKPTDMKLYLHSHAPTNDTLEVIVEFTNNVTDKKQNKTDTTRKLIKVTTQKANEKWQVTTIDELNVELL